MIAHLRGRVLSKSPGHAVVECGGVGYDVTISITTFTALPAEGVEASLYVYTNVREDQIALFGFSEMQEKRLFEKLIAVSGIGPKLAITVLSGIAVERLVTAIRGNDLTMLTRIPWVGKKTAERIVLELKDKLEDFAAAPVAATARLGGAGEDALSAMVNLGYPRAVAQKAVEAAMAKDPDMEDFEPLFSRRNGLNSLKLRMVFGMHKMAFCMESVVPEHRLSGGRELRQSFKRNAKKEVRERLSEALNRSRITEVCRRPVSRILF